MFLFDGDVYQSERLNNNNDNNNNFSQADLKLLEIKHFANYLKSELTQTYYYNKFLLTQTVTGNFYVPPAYFGLHQFTSQYI